MTRTFIQLAIVTTALAVVGPALAAPRSIAPSPATVEPTSQPTPAATMAGLCGITQSDVADIVDHYDLTPDMEGVADMLATPFDCSAYGDLCAAIGATNANAYACARWHDFKNHEAIAEIKEAAFEDLTTSGTTCTPDLSKCADGCAPYGVIHCGAVEIGGDCKSLAVCNDPRLRPLWGFGPLVVEHQGPLG